MGLLRLAAVFFLCSFPAVASALEAFASQAAFRNERGQPYVLVYWQISPATLRYKKDSLGRLTARIRTQIRVSTDTGIVYKEVFYLQTKPFNPGAEAAPRILEQERIPIPAGRVMIELALSEDGRGEPPFYHRDTLTISAEPLQYSSAQLLDTFFASGIKSVFLKDGYQLLPRPLNFYDEGAQTVHAYLELYGTNSLPAGTFPLIQSIYLSPRRGERDVMDVRRTDTIRAGAPVLAFRSSLSTATLPSGNYWLNASLRTINGAELSTTATFLQTINKHPAAAAVVAGTISDTTALKELNSGQLLDLSKTFVAKFDMAQMRAILKMMRPGADAADEAAIHGFLQRPDELYTRYFIYNHFAQRNRDDPARAWKDFSDVVREVNRRFNAGGTMGYESDRGIIYLRYGRPDEEVRVPNEAGALPYEIWRYNPNSRMHGPGVFLFYSPGSAASSYRLLHSTVTGETQNADWRSVLYSTGRSSGNSNARAEEYFGR